VFALRCTAVLLLLPLAIPAATGEEAAVVDRVLAVVDDDPILASDVERVLALGLYEPPEEELGDEALRRYILDGLIDQRLRFHEVDRFGFGQVPVVEIEAAVARIRRRFDSPEAFRRRLAEVGLDEQGLGLLVARQLMILAYVDERLGARIFVDLEDVQEFYDEELVPALAGEEPPPIASVREQIRSILRERRLLQEIGSWTEELRNRADVVINLEPRDELPPVVETVGEPPV
jgi:hypothetical protein